MDGKRVTAAAPGQLTRLGDMPPHPSYGTLIMGKVLQIRVGVVTWNEDLLEELWPKLAELAFSVPIRHEKRGVLEMVRALDEGLTFMKWPKARQEALGPGIRKAARLKQNLEKALADWRPREANVLSDQLEDVLDQLEQAFVA